MAIRSDRAADMSAITRLAEALNEFTDFDLYLMGLIGAQQVAPGLVKQPPACHECTVAVAPITVNDIINDEMAFYESMARRGEARQPLPYTSGFARGTTKPFYVATRGLATVDFRLSASAPPRRRSVKR